MKLIEFAILRILSDGEHTGRMLRVTLAKHEIEKSAPAFYRLMAQLEKAEWVKGWDEEREIAVKEHHYRLTNIGIRELITRVKL